MIPLTAFLLLAPLVAGQAPPAREHIERVLDRLIQYEAAEAPVTSACAALARQAGVEIHVSPDALEALPYGSDTKVKATLRNVSLRVGLERLLSPLGLTFEVSERGIEVQPHPALLRYGRRAGWQELETLRALHETRWESAKAAEVWQSRIQFRVQSPSPWTELSAAIQRAGAGRGDDILTVACNALGWTWFPQGDRVVILPERDQVQRLLRNRVSVRASHRPLIEVLQQLARHAHIAIRAEPGALAALPAQTRDNFSLLAERVTVGEALDQIAAATGLTYRVEDEAVVFTRHDAMGPFPDRTAANARPAASDPYVAKIIVPSEPGGLQLEILVRESELSPQAREARQKLIKDANEIFILELNRRAQSTEPAAP